MLRLKESIKIRTNKLSFVLDITNVCIMGVDIKMIPVIFYIVLKIGECDFKIKIVITVIGINWG